VPPERVIDYLALVGDSSDNVPGVKGIGEKGAQELIAQFGALEDILAHVQEITKKRPREALLAQEAEARLSKLLVTIHQDVPIALDPSTLQMSAPDTQALRHLYLELEFTSLLKDMGGSALSAPPPGDLSALVPRPAELSFDTDAADSVPSQANRPARFKEKSQFVPIGKKRWNSYPIFTSNFFRFLLASTASPFTTRALVVG